MSDLENMIDDNLRYLLKLLNKKNKGALRASSKTLLRRINELENTFKVWKIYDEVDKNTLRTIADIKIIQGLKISSLIGCARVYKYFKYLFKKHEELETISICFHTEWIAGFLTKIMRSAEDEENILLTIFSNLNLRSISLYDMRSKGDIFSCLPSTLPNLEKLFLIDWRWLSVKGLIEILNRSRSNLRVLHLCYLPGVEEEVNSLPNLEKLTLFSCTNLTTRGLKEILRISRNLRKLDLSYSNITGVGVEEGVNSLPNLETLKLFECIYLTDGGLKGFLRLFGCKLKVLDISQTNITGQGFKDEVISLPMLEKLNMGCCYNLTDGGLKETLRISGSSIRVLDVSATNITEQGFQDGVSLPMLEELNLDECDQLTDSGLLEILSITGSRLKGVNVYGTNNDIQISTTVKNALCTQYPSVQFKFEYDEPWMDHFP